MAWLLFCLSATAGTGLPPEVASRLEKAVELQGGDSTFVGRCTMVADTVVSTTKGRVTREVSMTVRLTHRPDGTVERRLLSFVEDGKDVTEKRRAKIDGTEPSREDDGEREKGDVRLPVGDDAGLYRFGRPTPVDGLLQVAFEPRPGTKDLGGLARGTIAWDPGTLDPVRIRYEALDPPGPLKELRGTLRYERRGGVLYLVEMHSEGLAGLLLMKRRFASTIRFTEIRPAGASGR